MDKITDGIDRSRVIVVCLTRKYMEKVTQTENSNDFCKIEYNYAWNKYSKSMVVVVMEKELKDTTKWTGTVAATLGGQIYHDFSTDKNLHQVCNALMNVKVEEEKTEQAPGTDGECCSLM